MPPDRSAFHIGVPDPVQIGHDRKIAGLGQRPQNGVEQAGQVRRAGDDVRIPVNVDGAVGAELLDGDVLDPAVDRLASGAWPVDAPSTWTGGAATPRAGVVSPG